MKKITISVLLLLAGIVSAQTSPINFEVGGNGASWAWNTFENGTPSPPLLIMSNPDLTGINTSATVASYTPVVGAPFYAGTETAHGSPLGTFTLSASNSTVKIMVWKPVISNVGIKFVTAGNASTGEINVANTLVNQWEELTFNFASKIGQPTSTGIDQIVIFIDSQNNRTTNNTCYFDNITFSNQVAVPVGPTLPVDFESTSLTYSFTNFGSAQTVKIANPNAGGINPSANVAKLTKSVGSETWAGSYIELGAPVNFSNAQQIKVKTWSPTAGVTVRMKLEKLSDPAIFVQSDATTTIANTWEELTFTFPAVVNANNYQRLVMFFNFGQIGNGESYYFDDVMMASSLSTADYYRKEFAVYPNPTLDILNIRANETISSIVIFNLLGQEMMSKNIDDTEIKLDLSGFQAGLYIIKTTIGGKIQISSVVKR
jgi:hypothetical protein